MSAVVGYIRPALQPDVEGLAELIDSTADELGPLACYDALIRPALVEVGARWERDELTVGDGHLITALTEQLRSALGDRVTVLVGGGPLARLPSGQMPRHVVRCSSATEAHAEGRRLLSRIASPA